MTIATILPQPRTIFLDVNNNPLSGGSVYTYIPTTTNPKTTWQDATGSTPNDNPIVLDGQGSCLLYGSGQYTLTVNDSAGNLVYTGLSQDLYSLITTGTNTFTGSNTFNGVVSLGSLATATTQMIGDTSTSVATDQFVANAIAANTTATTAPQGRLTLAASAPVMTTDATAQTTVYYLPYIGFYVPVYNGVTFANKAIGASGISLALDSNSGHTGYQSSGGLFDLFAFLNSSTLTLGTGPVWTSSTARSNAISMLTGFWTNTSSITLRYGTASGSTISVAANQATYLGTMYATANGQTGMAFAPSAASGGSNNILGLYNAYNRVQTTSTCMDSTSSWSYSTATWRAANGSNNNRISWVDGLQQSFADSYYLCAMAISNASTVGNTGIILDANTGTPSSITKGGNLSGDLSSPTAALKVTPQIGFHFIQAMENTNQSHSDFSNNQLAISLGM